MMKKYELAVVLHPDLEIDLEAPLERLDALLSLAKARVRKRDNWGKRKLAYQINKQSFGVYVFYMLELEPDRVAGLERGLGLSDEVLRHLLVAYEAPPESPPRSTSTANNEGSTSAESSDETPVKLEAEAVDPPKLSKPEQE